MRNNASNNRNRKIKARRNLSIWRFNMLMGKYLFLSGKFKLPHTGKLYLTIKQSVIYKDYMAAIDAKKKDLRYLMDKSSRTCCTDKLPISMLYDLCADDAYLKEHLDNDALLYLGRGRIDTINGVKQNDTESTHFFIWKK